MNRTVWWLVAGSWILSASRLLAQGSLPNIVLIVVDDAGIGDVGAYGPTPVFTPNLDRLAAEGMRFNRAYSGSSVCAPARSALMTGRHLGRTTVRGNTGGVSLRDSDVTLAEMLRGSGYATGGFGKWGLGAPGSPGAPERQGFDVFVGPYHQIHAHQHYTDTVVDTGSFRTIPENVGFFEPPVGLVDPARVHTQNLFIDEMKAFVTAQVQGGRPFFLYGAWNPPHFKSTIPADDPAYAPYAGLMWHEETKIQAALISMIDRHVGELLDHLDTLGVGDETLFIFTSDNGGDTATVHGDYPRNRSLRGRKGTLYEGGIRVPLIARWVGNIAPGTESDVPMFFPDIMPTLADVCGCTPPAGIDGLSVAPTLTGQGQQQLHGALYFEDRPFDFAAGIYSPHLNWAVHMGDWKGIVEGGSAIRIFDMANDPGESANVASQNQQVAQQMIAFQESAHRAESPQFDIPYRASTKGAMSFGVRQNELRAVRLINGSFESPELDPLGPNGGVLQIGGVDGWIGGGIQNPGNAVLNGEPPMFDDPIPAGEQVGWLRGGASGLSELLQVMRDAGGHDVALHLEDLHRSYVVALSIGRRMDVSPGNETAVLEVSLVGSTGYVYFAGERSTASQAPGSWVSERIELSQTQGTPLRETLDLDLGAPLTLRLAHGGGAGELFVDDVRVGLDRCYPDFDGNAALDVFDFLAFQNAFLQGDPVACGCDNAFAPGQCGIFDFLCFSDLFVLGCP